MPTSTVTSRGQITIPVEVRRKLGLKAGDRIDFFEDEGGKFRFEPKTGSMMDIRGLIPNSDLTVSIEEMDDVIGDHLEELDNATLSDEGLAAAKVRVAQSSWVA